MVIVKSFGGEVPIVEFDQYLLCTASGLRSLTMFAMYGLQLATLRRSIFFIFWGYANYEEVSPKELSPKF
ncbi:hypothetical protein H5410_027118 [Solanum commersonii]|uniref:Uncharacterized protein n=1 Tax=Solanum commersonii TaxID=4109 RepID=A0A9J5YYY3_SOLCO|nr:hypothetical protein H5410_027118 [Solanum commersonii]